MPVNPASNHPHSRLMSMFANLGAALGMSEEVMGKNLMEPLTSAKIRKLLWNCRRAVG
jgi:hypothetical protein